MADSSYRTGVIFILIAALAYASVPIFARALYATGLDAVDVLTWRFGVAAPLMWLLVRLRRSHGPVDPMSARQRWILLSLGALYGSITLVVFFALTMIPASLSIVLLYTYPAMVALISAFIGEPLPLRGWVALLLTSVGILLTVPEVLGGINAVPVLGILLGLLGGFLSALHVVISNRVLRKQSRAEAATALNITGALLLILLLLPFRQPDLPAVTSAWLGLAGLATFGTLGSMFFFLAGLRRIGASQAAILSTFEPVLVLILSVLLLDEVLSPIQITGAALIILSVVVLQIPLQALLRRLRRARGGAAL